MNPTTPCSWLLGGVPDGVGPATTRFTKEYAKNQELTPNTPEKWLMESQTSAPNGSASAAESSFALTSGKLSDYAKQKGLEVSLITSGFAFDQKRLTIRKV